LVRVQQGAFQSGSDGLVPAAPLGA
jgi:hypothetical protein